MSGFPATEQDSGPDPGVFRQSGPALIYPDNIFIILTFYEKDERVNFVM